MGRHEIMKQKATRQFRHNDDNSPNTFKPEQGFSPDALKPEQGFVIAYDKAVVDRGLAELEAEVLHENDLFLTWRNKAEELEAQLHETNVAWEATSARVVKLQAQLSEVAELPEKWKTEYQNVYMGDDDYKHGRKVALHSAANAVQAIIDTPQESE